MATDNLLKMASAVNQAIRQYQTKGSFEKPAGFRTIASFGSRVYPFLGYVLESRNEIIAAFRGTEAFFDIAADFEWALVPCPFLANAGQTHRGFTTLYGNVVRNQVLGVLRNRSPRKKLRIAGHSLGGALAALCALDVAANSRFRQPYVYTFGSPKTGDPVFAGLYERLVPKTIRVYNPYDIVPRLPLSTSGSPYRHVGQAYPISFNLSGPLQNHKMEHYFNALARKMGANNVE